MRTQLHMTPRKDIDVERWDHCVRTSPNGLIYSQSIFLDAMAENWMGIVADDYSLVCAVPWNKKYSIRYIYPPPYVQQSGIISSSVDHLHEQQVFEMMRAWCKYGEYYFNFANNVGGSPRKNFILSLQDNYDAARYPPDFRYDLKKASLFDLKYTASNDHQRSVGLYHENLKQKKKTGKDFLARLHKLVNVYSVHNNVLVRDVTDAAGQLLSTIVCLKDHRRIYLLLSATTNAGRKMRANHYLMDKLLQELMPSPLVLDFVGSDIEGIAHYYRNFTDVVEPYYLVKWNRLPVPLKWLKK